MGRARGGGTKPGASDGALCSKYYKENQGLGCIVGVEVFHPLGVKYRFNKYLVRYLVIRM